MLCNIYTNVLQLALVPLQKKTNLSDYDKTQQIKTKL